MAKVIQRGSHSSVQSNRPEKPGIEPATTLLQGKWYYHGINPLYTGTSKWVLLGDHSGSDSTALDSPVSLCCDLVPVGKE